MLENYGPCEELANSAVECCSNMTVKSQVELDIARLESQLKNKKRLIELLDENPQFEEMLTLLKRY